MLSIKQVLKRSSVLQIWTVCEMAQNTWVSYKPVLLNTQTVIRDSINTVLIVYTNILFSHQYSLSNTASLINT